MLVKFGTNIGTVDAKALGLDFTKCTKDSDPIDLPEEKVAEIKKVCGEFSVFAFDRKAAKAAEAEKPVELPKK